MTKPDESIPSLNERTNRGRAYLQLSQTEQGIRGACCFIMLDAVLNVAWHAQQASEKQPEVWAATSRFEKVEDCRLVYLLPELKFERKGRRRR